MVILGLILFSAPVVAGILLVTQTTDRSRVELQAANHTWLLEPRWILLAGAGLAFVAVVGMAMMRSGAARGRARRREREELLAEIDRLSGRGPDEDEWPFFGDDQTGDVALPRPANRAYSEP